MVASTVGKPHPQPISRLKRIAGDGRFARRQAPVPLVVAALVVALFMLAPAAYLVIRASDAGTDALSLLSRERNLEIIRNSALLAGLVGFTSALIGVPFAWLLERTDLPLRRLFSLLAPLPLAIPSYVGALTYIDFFGPRGMVQRFLDRNTPIDSIPSIYGFWGSFVALTLFTFPYVLLQVRAALSRLDPSFDDTSRSLGLGPWRTFLRATLPMLRPAIVAGALLSALYAISDFGVVTLLRYDTFTRAIYTQYRASFNRSHAALLALVLVVFAVLLVSAEIALRGRGVYHRVGGGARRRSRRVPLGRWAIPAVAFCTTVLTFALGVPLGVIAWWLIDRQGEVESTRRLAFAIWHSVQLGAIVGLATLAIALPVAILSVRYRSRFSNVIERICYLGYGLPGIVIALTFIFFGIRVATPLYQTLPLLIIALAVRFVPQALGAERTSLLTVSPRVEEAARSLGRNAGQTFARVTLPLSRTGFVAGWAIVFVAVMKELPITLLLAPIEYRTLATEIWTAAGSGAYSDAAIPALILVVIASAPTLLFRSERRQASPLPDEPAPRPVATDTTPG
jgi:iron(III) transport system permease protein